MVATRRLADLTVPWGRQEIQLEEVDFETGGVPLLRVRIREGKRFTIFDIDAGTATAWSEAMQAWAAAQADIHVDTPAAELAQGASA
jgi:hypothetical protein